MRRKQRPLAPLSAAQVAPPDADDGEPPDWVVADAAELNMPGLIDEFFEMRRRRRAARSARALTPTLRDADGELIGGGR